MLKMHILQYFIFRNDDTSIDWQGTHYEVHPEETHKANRIKFASPFYAHLNEWFDYLKDRKGKVSFEDRLAWYDAKLPLCHPIGFMKDLPSITLLGPEDMEIINAAKPIPTQDAELTVAHVASLYSKRAVSPFEVASLRRDTFTTVAKHLPTVDEVLSGTRTWSNVQVRLFATLLDRVLPKLPTSYLNTHEAPSDKKRMTELSREELEQIALTGRIPTDIDASPISSLAVAADEMVIAEGISDIDKEKRAADYFAARDLMSTESKRHLDTILKREEEELKKKLDARSA